METQLLRCDNYTRQGYQFSLLWKTSGLLTSVSLLSLLPPPSPPFCPHPPPPPKAMTQLWASVQHHNDRRPCRAASYSRASNKLQIKYLTCYRSFKYTCCMCLFHSLLSLICNVEPSVWQYPSIKAKCGLSLTSLSFILCSSLPTEKVKKRGEKMKRTGIENERMDKKTTLADSSLIL